VLTVSGRTSDVDTVENPGDVLAVVDPVTTATRTVECLSNAAGRDVDETKQVHEWLVIVARRRSFFTVFTAGAGYQRHCELSARPTTSQVSDCRVPTDSLSEQFSISIGLLNNALKSVL